MGDCQYYPGPVINDTPAARYREALGVDIVHFNPARWINYPDRAFRNGTETRSRKRICVSAAGLTIM